jgi:hypothetical protein
LEGRAFAENEASGRVLILHFVLIDNASLVAFSKEVLIAALSKL